MRPLAHEMRGGLETGAVGDAARGQVADRRLVGQVPGRGLGELACGLVVLDEHRDGAARRFLAQLPDRRDHERQQRLGDARRRGGAVERVRQGAATSSRAATASPSTSADAACTLASMTGIRSGRRST